ncbi:MAG TPA: RluA family pseudouridine synthase [Acidimicrobiales bacterium]|nr:RluA family pseudouridine synthase [Acidimicrobiales bacterium]
MKEVVPASLEGERIDRVVAMLTELPRAEIALMIEDGAVRIGGTPVAARSRKVREGDIVEIDVPERPVVPALRDDPDVDVPVVHVDADVIVVDKPPGLVVHPGAGHDTGTMVQGLLARYPELAELPREGAGEPDRPGIVHRLDAGTSGLLVVARTVNAYHSLVAQLSARDVQRHYRALVLGTVEANAGEVDAPIGRSEGDPTKMAVANAGREARTRYEVLRRYHEPIPTTELACKLETGRTHQIRVHLAAIGHPVVGDGRYGGERPAIATGRPFLHAERLAFVHPRSGEVVTFTSVLPSDLEDVRRGLA